MVTKLSRALQLEFGLNGDASHFGQFGSRVIAPPGLKTKDPASIQALSAFVGNGLKDAINSGNKAAFLEDLNGLFFLAFRQICSIFQDGIPAWEPATTYFTGSIVRRDGTSELYASSIDNNAGNALPTQTNNGFWQYLNPQSVDAGTIIPFAGSVIPAGKLLCDGASYVQAVQPNLFAAIGSTWNTFNGAADPGVGNFRVPDLRGLTLMGAGHGTGFAARTLAQLVGEETHILLTGEMPIHNHPLNQSPNPATVGTSVATIPGAGGGNFLPVANAQAISLSVGNAGGGGGHNNMQPTAGINWIIKT